MAIRNSLVPHGVLLMPLRSKNRLLVHPRGLTVLEESHCKSRPGHP